MAPSSDGEITTCTPERCADLRARGKLARLGVAFSEMYNN
jgi:hypothetical protein